MVSQIPTEVLLSVTEMQLRYMDPKSLNILAKKINAYRIQQGEERLNNSGTINTFNVTFIFILLSEIIIEIVT